jgi:type IV secretion system protein VirD4
MGRSPRCVSSLGGTGMGIRTRIACLGVGAVMGLSAATQIVAWRYQYQPALGWGFALGVPKLAQASQSDASRKRNDQNQKMRSSKARAKAAPRIINPAKLYPPWNFLIWQKKWGQLPAHRATLNMGVSLLMFGIILGALLIKLFDGPDNKSTKRERGWGDLKDAKSAQLLGDDGCVIGLLGKGLSKRVLTTTDMRPTLVTGATRSGKGRGHVMPTLLLWRKSVIVHDPKSELYALTAGWRAPWSHTLVLNPRKMTSARFNPLAEIRLGASEMADVQRLVSVLSDPAGRRDHDAIWDIAAAAILEAAILHVLYAAPAGQKNLVSVKALVNDLDRSANIMKTTLHRKHDGVDECHPVIAAATRAYLSKHDKYRSSVEATVQSYLKWIAGEDIERTLSASDFRVGDLVCLDNAMSLYVQVAPADQKALRPFLRLLFSAVALGLTTEVATDTWGRPKRHPLLMVMDEFPLLGRLDFFEKTLRLMSGYGIKPMLVAQSLNDIVETYGPNNTILDNTHIYTAFAALDPLTQDKVSKLTGLVMEDRNSVSTSGAIMDGVRSRSSAEHERPLMEPGEIRGLADKDQLVFMAGYKPWRTQKVRFDLMEPFKSRTKIPAPNLNAQPKFAGIPHPWDRVQIIKMGVDPGEKGADKHEETHDRDSGSGGGYDPRTGEIYPRNNYKSQPCANDYQPQHNGQHKAQQLTLDFSGQRTANSISSRATPSTPPKGWGERAEEAAYLAQVSARKGGHDVDPFAKS